VTSTQLYHNPRCSKSRAALALLEERGVDHTVVRYLDTGLSADDIDMLLAALALPASDVVRRGEAAYKALDDRSEAALRAAMTQSPILLERPVFLHRGRAVIGRPPERILELLDD